MVDFELIEDDDRLNVLVDEWNNLPELAIDLEMEAHLHHFGLHLALVQVSDGKNIWLVDFLRIKDPSSLVRLFENPVVLKVFHDISFDFRVLGQLLHCSPKNIFDTKVACLLAGRKTISLSGLLEEEFGVQKDERFQKVDWLRRPMNKDMLAYAAGDVSHLLQLKDVLVDELKKKGRFDWFVGECSFLESQTYDAPPRTFQDVKGSRGLTDKERGIFKALFTVRDAMAEKLDKPVFFVVPDKVLLQIAKGRVTVDVFRSLKRVHPLVKRQAQRFVDAAARAKPVAKEPKPYRRISHKQQEAIDALLASREVLAQRLDVEPFVLMTREQAEILVVDKTDSLRDWQRSLLADAKII